MDFILDIAETDPEILRDRLSPEQFRALYLLISKFGTDYINPAINVEDVKSERDKILKLLMKYKRNEEGKLSPFAQPLVTKEERINELVLAIEKNSSKLKEFESLWVDNIAKFNEHNKKDVSNVQDVKDHYNRTLETYNAIIGLRESIITLQRSITQDEDDLDLLRLQQISLEKKESLVLSNMEAISSFIELFKIAYSDKKISAITRTTKKSKNPERTDDRKTSGTSDGDGGSGGSANNNNNDNIITDDVDNTVSKKPRRRGPNDRLPNPQLIGQAIDAEQCIYMKDEKTLVKIIPAGTNKAMLYIEMSVIPGFLSIEDTHTEDNFPTDRYELCPDMSKKDKYVLLETTDRIHNLPLNGNINERFCIVYELLQSLKMAHDQFGFRYNKKDSDTLKYKLVTGQERVYADGRVLCTSDKRVIISDLSKATKSMINNTTVGNSGKKKKHNARATLEASDVALFERLLRQLYIPNFTHKLIGLLSSTSASGLIHDIDVTTKKLAPKSSDNKRDSDKKEKKQKKFITFDKFIDAIGDTWNNQDFV